MLRKHKHSAGREGTQFKSKKETKKILMNGRFCSFLLSLNVVSHSSVVVVLLLFSLCHAIFFDVVVVVVPVQERLKLSSLLRFMWFMSKPYKWLENYPSMGYTTTFFEEFGRLFTVLINGCCKKSSMEKKRINVTGVQLALKLQTFDCIHISRELVRFPLFALLLLPLLTNKNSHWSFELKFDLEFERRQFRHYNQASIQKMSETYILFAIHLKTILIEFYLYLHIWLTGHFFCWYLQLQWNVYPICQWPVTLRGKPISDLNGTALVECMDIDSNDLYDIAGISENILLMQGNGF